MWQGLADVLDASQVRGMWRLYVGSHLGMNVCREPPQKRLADITPHLDDVEGASSKVQTFCGALFVPLVWFAAGSEEENHLIGSSQSDKWPRQPGSATGSCRRRL